MISKIHILVSFLYFETCSNIKKKNDIGLHPAYDNELDLHAQAWKYIQEKQGQHLYSCHKCHDIFSNHREIRPLSPQSHPKNSTNLRAVSLVSLGQSEEVRAPYWSPCNIWSPTQRWKSTPVQTLEDMASDERQQRDAECRSFKHCDMQIQDHCTLKWSMHLV